MVVLLLLLPLLGRDLRRPQSLTLLHVLLVKLTALLPHLLDLVLHQLLLLLLRDSVGVLSWWHVHLPVACPGVLVLLLLL